MQITRGWKGLSGKAHAICRFRFERICSLLGGDLQGEISARLLACRMSMCLQDSDRRSDEQSFAAYVGCGSMRLLIMLLLDYRFVQSVLLVSRPFFASPLSLPASIHSQSMLTLISSYFLPIINPEQLCLRSPPSPQASPGRESLPIFSYLSQSQSYSVLRLWFSSGVTTIPSFDISHFALCSKIGCAWLQKVPWLVLIIRQTSMCPSPSVVSAVTAVMVIILELRYVINCSNCRRSLEDAFSFGLALVQSGDGTLVQSAASVEQTGLLFLLAAQWKRGTRIDLLLHRLQLLD